MKTLPRGSYTCRSGLSLCYFGHSMDVYQRRRLVALSALAAVFIVFVLLIKSCGGDDDSTTATPLGATGAGGASTTSQADYISQGDAICLDANTSFANVDQTDPAKAAKEEASIVSGELEQLQSLPQPDDGTTKLGNYLNALEKQAAAYQDRATAAERGDDATVSDLDSTIQKAGKEAANSAKNFGFEPAATRTRSLSPAGARAARAAAGPAAPSRPRPRTPAARSPRPPRCRSRPRPPPRSRPRRPPRRPTPAAVAPRPRQPVAAPTPTAAAPRRAAASARRSRTRRPAPPAPLRGRRLRPGSVELRVAPAGLDQLVVRARLGDPPVLEHHDPPGSPDRRQPVGDHDRRAPGEQPLEPLLDHPLGAHVDVRRRLVEDQDPRLGEQRPREGDDLALAGRERDRRARRPRSRARRAAGRRTRRRRPRSPPRRSRRRSRRAGRRRCCRGSCPRTGSPPGARSRAGCAAPARAGRAGRARRRAPCPAAGHRSARRASPASTCRRRSRRPAPPSARAARAGRCPPAPSPRRPYRSPARRGRVGEPDVVELDLAADRPGSIAPGWSAMSGSRVEQVEDLVERRHALLVGRVELRELLDRVEERCQVADEGDQDADLDVAVDEAGSRRRGGSPPVPIAESSSTAGK